jgi:hypothetical protein
MRFKALLVVALLMAACGGTAAGSDSGVASLSDSSTTTVAAEADPEEAAIAFTECMRENGIDMEDPTVDADGNVIPGRPTDLPEPDGEGGAGEVGPGALGEDLQAAFEECGDLLEGTTFGFTGEDQAELEDQLLALAQCLRDQGIDVADPDLSGGPDIVAGEGGDGLRANGPFGIDFQDPEVQAALDQCQEYVPNFQGGPGGGGPAFNVAPPGDDSTPSDGSDG